MKNLQLKQYQSKGPKTKEHDEKVPHTETAPPVIDSNYNQQQIESPPTQSYYSEPQHGNVISLQEFSSHPTNDETQYSQAPTAPIELANVDPFQEFNAFNMTNSYQPNSSGPSLQNYFSPASNVVDIFGATPAQNNYQQHNEMPVPMTEYQTENTVQSDQNVQLTPVSQYFQTNIPIEQNIPSNYFDPNQYNTYFHNITPENQTTSDYSQFPTQSTENLATSIDFTQNLQQIISNEEQSTVAPVVEENLLSQESEVENIIEPCQPNTNQDENQQSTSHLFNIFQNSPIIDNSSLNQPPPQTSFFSDFATQPTTHDPFQGATGKLNQKQNSFFDSFNAIDPHHSDLQSSQLKSDTNSETLNSTNVSVAASFFSNTNSSSNTDSPINAFNILSLPENNSETISTISERTENESSLGKRDEDEDISNSESLNQLSAHMSSILLAEDKVAATQSENEQQQQQSNNFDYEQKLQELQLLLQSEKIRNEELNFKTQNQATTIEELRLENQKLQYEKTMNVGVNVENLQEQLQNHIKTVGILVGEKSELTASLNKTQNIIREKSIEVDELQSRLSASRHKVSELEKELTQSKTSCDRLSQSQQKLLSEMEQFQDEINRLTIQYRDSMEENEMLNQKINLKSKEIQDLQENLNQKTSEINMLQLRVEQLKYGETNPGDESQIVALQRQKDNYEQQIVEYQKLVEQIRSEKDQTSQHYQSYLQNLNNQTSSLATRVEELTYEKEKLVKREEELVKHIGVLEKSLQHQMNEKDERIEKQLEVVRDEKMEEQCKVLSERIVELENEAQNNMVGLK